MIVIGVSGKIGVGKTTLAREICARFPGWAPRLRSFGSEIKLQAAALYGYDPEWNETQAGKENIVFHPDLPGGSASVRQVLVALGHRRRQEDPDYWCKRLLEGLESSDRAQPLQMVVIDDVRMPNEAAMVRRLRGYLVRIEPFDGWKPGPCAEDVSECALDSFAGWDAYARMTMGQEGLRRAVDDVLRQIARVAENAALLRGVESAGGAYV